MRDLQRIYKEVMRDVRRAGIKPGRIVEVTAEPKLKHWIGLCEGPNKEHPRGYKIILADFFLHPDVSLQDAKRVMAHEIMHTVGVKDAHGPAYKELCSRLHKKPKSEEVKQLLKQMIDVDGAYGGFITAVELYVAKKESRLVAVSHFLNNNPSATSSDILGFISKQPDFAEDIVYSKPNKTDKD